MREPYRLAEDCPQCGQKDAPGAWAGARMSCTSWGHSFECCSHACGVAYRDNPHRLTREIIAVKREIAAMKAGLRALTEQRRELRHKARKARQAARRAGGLVESLAQGAP